MGIPRGTARLLLEEAKRRPFGGTLLQLGRSSVYFGQRDLERWADLHDFDLAPLGDNGVLSEVGGTSSGSPHSPSIPLSPRGERGTPPPDPRGSSPEVGGTSSGTSSAALSHDPRLARQGCLSDEALFRQLGFDRVMACDISDWEGAEVIVDLNRPVPEEHHGRFDAILDPGTILQIFHLPQVLENLHRMLAPGGRIVHAGVPSNNHIDLGFYMISPTLFADFYEANRYRLAYEYLCVYSPYWQRGRLHTGPWKVYDYTPGSLDHLSFGRYGGLQTAIFAVAEKGEESTGDAVPQLGQYRQSWELYRERAEAGREAAAGELVEAGEAGGEGWTDRLRTAADRWFDQHPAWNRAYLPVKRAKEALLRRLPRKMPPLVAKY